MAKKGTVHIKTMQSNNKANIIQGKGTSLVTYTVYSEMCYLHLAHPWGAVGSHSAAPGDQLQILSQYLGQEYWLEIDLYICFDGGNRST